jgi:hypothetical protein
LPKSPEKRVSPKRPNTAASVTRTYKVFTQPGPKTEIALCDRGRGHKNRVVKLDDVKPSLHPVARFGRQRAPGLTASLAIEAELRSRIMN